MSEMIERVARAFASAAAGAEISEEGWISCFDECPEDVEHFRRAARAALAAMREPTEAMTSAGSAATERTEEDGFVAYTYEHHMEAAWRAMIDEALKL